MIPLGDGRKLFYISFTSDHASVSSKENETLNQVSVAVWYGIDVPRPLDHGFGAIRLWFPSWTALRSPFVIGFGCGRVLGFSCVMNLIPEIDMRKPLDALMLVVTVVALTNEVP